MGTALIVILLLLAVIVAASFALGRTSYEVESARDTEFVELEGAWIRYDVIGGGPPVVLVHGWLSSSRVWETLAQRLAQRFTVYTLDLTGFGESDKPLSGYGVRYGSRLLYAFCAHFGLTRASIIGHDIGGAMAVKLAADHPDVVGRLVLVATPANEEQIDLPTLLWLAMQPVFGPLFYALGRYARPVRKMWMRSFVLDPEDLTDEVTDDAGQSTPAAASKTLGVARREIARGRLVRQSRMIRIPVLLVAGEEDQIVDPQAVGDWSGGLEQAEVVLLDECGHMPMIERTAEFNARILAFLTGDPRYLDYVEEARPAREEVAEEQPETVERKLPYPPYEDTSEDVTLDLSPHERALREERMREERAREERGDEDLPNVVRREGDRFPPRGRAPEGEEERADDGAEDRPRRRRQRREPADGDVIPDVPKDLFEWPAAWEEFRPREGSRRRPPEEDEEGAEGPEEPPRR